MKSLDGQILPERPAYTHKTYAIRRTTVATTFYLLLAAGICLVHFRYGAWFLSRDLDEEFVKRVRFRWDEIQATEDLQFHTCYNGFKCAKLQLPLDYFNGTHPNSTISLALVKLPARVPVNDSRYGGPVLVNPGGPGGSGVGLALLEAYDLQTIIDSDIDVDNNSPNMPGHASAKYFDIIGFDPRGIGMTEPSAKCMPDSASWWSWRLRESTEGSLDSSDAALGRLWSMNQAYGSSCKQTIGEDDAEPDIKQYMTTASVARDMLEVAERHSDYVSKQLQKPVVPRSDVKLQYWGFSYGTYLGYTFAAMFPDRVGRLVLDGVVNSDDYNASLGNGSLIDNERAMTSFYTFCLHAGPEACPLTTPTSSFKDIETRVHKILKTLYHNPFPLFSQHGPEVITYSDARNLIFGSLYSPLLAFPIVAQALHAIELGGGEILSQLSRQLRSGHIFSCSLDPAAGLQYDVPEYAILCSDGADVSHEDIDTFREYMNVTATMSPTTGAIWAILRLKCNSWKIRAVHRYLGDFSAANTSNPILFVSNTADPVTPLNSGRIMHARFPGSGLLIQDSAGHCSTSQPNTCSISHIRAYFQHLALPSNNALCVPPPSPWSLNSTDPESPFYEPSLGERNVNPMYASTPRAAMAPKDRDIEGLFHGMHRVSNSDEKTIQAARNLARWMASENRFFPVGDVRAERVRGMLWGM